MIPFSPLMIDCDYPLLYKLLFNTYKPSNNQVITYSVRTSIYTYLKMKNYPSGSKVLITSINIPTILDIIQHLNLEYIAIDLDLNTLDMNSKDLSDKLKQEDIKCIIYSHLFGKINDIDSIIDICDEKSIHFIEDCAECFTESYRGNPRSDMICFSFGSIKKCSCFGGSSTFIKNKNELEKFKKELKRYKYQTTFSYIVKLIKYFFISFLTNNRYVNVLFRYISYLCKINTTDLFVNLIRNIPAKDLINNISYQPCRLLTQYLLCRIQHYKDHSIKNETYISENLLSPYVIPGHKEGNSNSYWLFPINYWLFPIYYHDIRKIMNKLDENDINYVKKISQLICIDSKCINSKNIIDNIIFLPIHCKTNIRYTKYITDKLNNIIREDKIH